MFSYIPADWLRCRDVTRHGFVVMYVVSRFIRIIMRNEKQACKQLHCIKAKSLEPASINGLHNQKSLG